MKYYLVTETDGQYHIDYVSQKLVIAESLEDAFALTHSKPIDYVSQRMMCVLHIDVRLEARKAIRIT